MRRRASQNPDAGRYGGFEMCLDTFADVAFEIARGCGSTGWVCSFANNYPLFICNYLAEAQDEVWGDDPRALVSSSGVPTGTAIPVDGGYRLGGAWRYCSGIDNSSWMIMTANVADTEPTEKGFALVPTADFHIDDNWDVIGLAGTGSKDASCEDLFVPSHRFLHVSDVNSGNTPGAGPHEGGVYKIPVFAGFSIGGCAPILGMARGALDEFLRVTLGRETRGAALSGPTSMIDIPAIQLQAAEAAASIDAAKALVDQDCRDTMARARGTAQHRIVGAQQGRSGVRGASCQTGGGPSVRGRRRRAVQRPPGSTLLARCPCRGLACQLEMERRRYSVWAGDARSAAGSRAVLKGIGTWRIAATATIFGR